MARFTRPTATPSKKQTGKASTLSVGQVGLPLETNGWQKSLLLQSDYVLSAQFVELFSSSAHTVSEDIDTAQMVAQMRPEGSQRRGQIGIIGRPPEGGENDDSHRIAIERA